MRFIIEDALDGWWHCRDRLHAEVIEQPKPIGGVEGVYWLILVDPEICWHGDHAYSERWGRDHPLVHAMKTTNRAMVLAMTEQEDSIVSGVPVYPAQPADDGWVPVLGLGIKARLIFSEQD